MRSASTVPGSAPRAVFAQLADGRPLTVADLTAHTGLPRSTVVDALRRLADAGQVEQRGPGRQGRGRPSHSWSIAAPPGPVAVVVAAAHGTVVGVVTTKGEVLSAREAEPLEATVDGRRAGRALTELDLALADASVQASELSMAVVGLPGPSGFTRQSGTEADQPASGHLRRFRTWDGGSPTELLADRLGCPVHSENDANLAALGEAVLGAGAGLDTVLHVSLAHGTGAGLVIDGRLHRGRSGLAGEIGHLHADDDGRLCHCGARGCFWHSRSIPALLAALAEAHGRPFTLADVARAADEDDHDVVRALLGFGYALGRRLADAVVYIDPDAIVIEGSLSGASGVIADGVRDAIRRYAPPTMARGTQVLVGTLGEMAPLVGAVALGRSEGLFARVADLRPSSGSSQLAETR